MSGDFFSLHQLEGHLEVSAPREHNHQNSGPSTLAISRKRIRCDSDPKGCRPPPEKMYKGLEDGIDIGATVEGSIPTETIAALAARFKSSWKRDDQFYLEDGSCVLLVEDTLFSVHRSMLSKDSSSFRTMFSLPQADNDVDGRDDDHPIMLPGDTAEEFRHFLLVLYALPHEVKQLTSPSAKLDHLIDITRIANKYSFKSIETWALDAIQDYVNRKPSPILNSFSPSTFPGTISQSIWSSNKEAQLTKLIRLAQLCQHDSLMTTMISQLRQLMSSSVHYAYLAMKLSDELDLRSLRGPAYLEVLQKASVVKKVRIDVFNVGPPSTNAISTVGLIPSSSISSAEGDRDSNGHPMITREQQLKLLAGYYRLTAVWDKLRTTPPHIEHAISCGASWHQQGCIQSWSEWWKEKARSDNVMNLGLADVIGRLKVLQKDYDRWGTASYMHLDCRTNAKKAIVDIIKRVEDSLPDFFEDAGGCEV